MRKADGFVKSLFVEGLCLAAVLGLTGCGDKSPLDPGDPVSLTVWHYYNGSQQAAFDALVEEFNETAGRELGIYVQGYSQGSVSDLETAVRDAIGGKVGADAMPDLFSSYADTAYEVEHGQVHGDHDAQQDGLGALCGGHGPHPGGSGDHGGRHRGGGGVL